MRTGLAIGVLPGRPAGAGRAREGLRDRHPLDGGRALDVQAEVVAVPALRHQQAEVQGGAGYPVFRPGGTPRPYGAIRAGELDSDLGRGHALAVHGVAERARADADVRYVAQPVRGLAADAE